MSYVAGFISQEGELGRTFWSNTNREAVDKIALLVEELKDDEAMDYGLEKLLHDCVITTKLGHYFIGSLES